MGVGGSQVFVDVVVYVCVCVAGGGYDFREARC